MSTLAIMKARIANELVRSDLTSEIAYAISDAIALYQKEPWAFLQSRANQLATVASQYVYTSTDASWIADIRRLEWVHLLRDGASAPMRDMSVDHVEQLNGNGTFGGEPLGYAYWGENIFLYPIPNEVYTLRAGGRFAVAEPATDAETGNPWMTKAERIVRQKAKWLLAKDVIHDDGLAQRIEMPLIDAESAMRDEFNGRQKGQRNQVEATTF